MSHVLVEMHVAVSSNPLAFALHSHGWELTSTITMIFIEKASVQRSCIRSSKHSSNNSSKSVAKRPRKFALQVKLDVLCSIGSEHEVHVGHS